MYITKLPGTIIMGQWRSDVYGAIAHLLVHTSFTNLLWKVVNTEFVARLGKTV